MNQAEVYVLCEGYHDRAFLAGLLVDGLGWTEPKRTDGRIVVKDPFTSTNLRGGEYGFAKGDRFIRVVPAQTETKIRPLADARLKERRTKRLEALVLCFDSDTEDGRGLASRRASFSGFASTVGGTLDAEGMRFVIDGVPVHIVVWRTASDAVGEGVPQQHTLERVVCSAVSRTAPDRAASVAAYLAATPLGRGGPKEHAWSYMAKWHGENGCEDFYRQVWRDASISKALKDELERTGTWQVFETV